MVNEGAPSFPLSDIWGPGGGNVLKKSSVQCSVWNIVLNTCVFLREHDMWHERQVLLTDLNTANGGAELFDTVKNKIKPEWAVQIGAKYSQMRFHMVSNTLWCVCWGGMEMAALKRSASNYTLWLHLLAIPRGETLQPQISAWARH